MIKTTIEYSLPFIGSLEFSHYKGSRDKRIEIIVKGEAQHITINDLRRFIEAVKEIERDL